jgi:protein arginine N-methyltransferase 1
MYSVAGYGRMLADRTRVAAYTEAMTRAITPGCTVLDIGTGTGFFALLACRLGARTVYAIEPDPVVQLARIAARDNGLSDQIAFFQDLSTRVELPEQVDVIVSDLRSVLPWFQHHIPAIVDARRRLLKPGGVLIAEKDVLWAAVAQMPDFYAKHVAHQPEDSAEFDMSAARLFGTSDWDKVHASPDELLTEPARCAELNYREVLEATLDTQVEWIAERSGVGHGFVAWFDTTLLDDVGFSNAPGKDRLVYGNAFFPWREPIPITAGDRIAVSLRADLADDDYIWRWSTVVTRDREEIARFAQSNFSVLRALGSLGLRKASDVPSLVHQVEIDRFVLGCVDGTRTAREIAEAVTDRFPESFPRWESALNPVIDLLNRYNE